MAIRVGAQAIADRVRLIEYFDTPPLLVALCSAQGCENLARGFQNQNVPVCFDHGAPKDRAPENKG